MTLPYEQSYEGQLRRAVGNRKIILPAVRAVIADDDGRILFVKRRDDGSWVMPAGGLELDEAPFDALRREVREETGLEVRSASLMAVYSFSGVNAYGNEAHRLSFVFRVEEWSGALSRTTDETVDARFFDPDAVDGLPPVYRQTVADWRRFDGRVIMKEHQAL